MNKIIMSESRIIIDQNESYLLEFNNKIKSTIIVEKNIDSKIIICGKDIDYDLTINVYNNSNVIINSLNNNVNSKIIVNLYENSSIEYNHSIVSDIDVECNFVINHLEKNTKAKLNNNGINLNSNKLFFNIDGIVNKESLNTISEQDSKIINFLNGNSKIIPNFIIDNNDIVANHSAYIGNFNEEDIFYIKSRGISNEEMYHLLYRSLLLGKMNLKEEKEMFNKLLKEWGLL